MEKKNAVAQKNKIWKVLGQFPPRKIAPQS